MQPVCPSCQKPFTPHRHVPHQRYCSSRKCQRARKRLWERGKLAEDPDYKSTRTDAQRAWLDARPRYWSEYRATHPENAARNRELQRERNRRRGHPPGTPGGPPDASVIAKTDACRCDPPDFPLPSGRYALVFVGDEPPGLIAKKDAFAVVDLRVLPGFSHLASP